MLLGIAEQELSSSLTGLLVAAVPLVGAVLVTITGDDSLGPRRIAGLLVGFAGVAALVGFDIGASNAGAVAGRRRRGDLLRPRPDDPRPVAGRLPSLGVVAGSLAITAVFYLPFGVAAWPDHAPDAETWLAVVGLAVICTAVAFIVFFELIAEVGPARSTVITYFNPAVALVLGALVLDEQITATTGLGFALILVGSVLATSRRPGRRTRARTGRRHGRHGRGRRADGRRRRLPRPRALTAPHRTAPHRGHGTEQAGRRVRLLARGIGYGLSVRA